MKRTIYFLAVAVFCCLNMTSCFLLSTSTAPTQVTPSEDYAPKSAEVRGYMFNCRASDQSVQVYFEGQFSVNPDYTMANGSSTLAEYYYVSSNIAKIKYGPGKRQLMELHFTSANGGIAIYENVSGSFTMKKMR